MEKTIAVGMAMSSPTWKKTNIGQIYAEREPKTTIPCDMGHPLC